MDGSAQKQVEAQRRMSGGQKQLSLERLYVNRTVRQTPTEPQKLLHLKQQAINIYKALLERPLYTMDLRAMACQYGTRIKELREWLRQTGKTIDCIPQSGGNNIYRIVPFHGSRYQAELMTKAAKAASKI